jgi:dTDP-4-dehydrorhamnose reductase
MYARTKATGEVTAAPHLTIRTSIIGPEIRANRIGLMDWFLGQPAGMAVQGYLHTLWNGVTTLELAQAIAYAVQHPHVTGLVHLTSPRVVSKYELLQLLRQIFAKDVSITPAAQPHLDRTLKASRTDWQYVSADYPEMLAELKAWMAAHEIAN